MYVCTYYTHTIIFCLQISPSISLTDVHATSVYKHVHKLPRIHQGKSFDATWLQVRVLRAPCALTGQTNVFFSDTYFGDKFEL